MSFSFVTYEDEAEYVERGMNEEAEEALNEFDEREEAALDQLTRKALPG